MGENPPLTGRNWFVQNWKWIVLPCLALALLVVFAFRAGYFTDDRNTAVRLIEQFHARMSASQFAQICDDAGTEFRERESRDNFIKDLEQARDEYGQFKQFTYTELAAITGLPARVRARCDSTYEKGDATELFAFAKQGGKLRLTFYQITPGTAKSDSKAEIQVAQGAAAEFYRRLSGVEYDAIFDGMADDLKASKSREETAAFFQGINDKFGECEPAILQNIDVAQNHDGHFVGLRYDRKCTGGDLHERLAFKIVGGRAQLRGYH